MQKFVYLLELQDGDQPVNLGVFTSLPKAKAFLKTLSKKHQYAIYKLPTNEKLFRGRKMDDMQGFFDHWHFGTFDAEYIREDDDGNVVEHTERIDVEWPD